MLTGLFIAMTGLGIAQTQESNDSIDRRPRPALYGTTGADIQEERRERRVDQKTLPSTPEERERIEKQREMERRIFDEARKNIKEDVRENREMMKEKIGEIKEERREAMSAFKEKEKELRQHDQDIKKRLQNATPEEREKIKEDIRLRRETMKEKGKEMRNDFRTKITDVKERARRIQAHNHARALVQRFHAAVKRLTHLSDRAESRLKKMSEDGVNTLTLVAQLNDIKKLIVVAEEKVNVLKETYESLINSDNPQEVIAGGKEMVNELKKHIQDIQEKLRELVVAMKNLKSE